MTPRRQRLWLVVGIVAGVSIAGGLALSAFRQNVTFFFDPSQVAAGKVKPDEHFRLGGMVSRGSVHRTPGSPEVHFNVTDFRHDVPVVYTGVLPDLFREGQGVIAHGHLAANGVFMADEVLAKHDEKYMPPKIAQALKDAQREGAPAAAGAPPAQSTAPGTPRGQASPGVSSDAPSSAPAPAPRS